MNLDCIFQTDRNEHRQLMALGFRRPQSVQFSVRVLSQLQIPGAVSPGYAIGFILLKPGHPPPRSQAVRTF
jgi:hypothetical protein